MNLYDIMATINTNVDEDQTCIIYFSLHIVIFRHCFIFHNVTASKSDIFFHKYTNILCTLFPPPPHPRDNGLIYYHFSIWLQWSNSFLAENINLFPRFQYILSKHNTATQIIIGGLRAVDSVWNGTS